MALQVGDSIERYVVEAVIGEGGMAVVYRVRHTTLDSLHALKVLQVGSSRVRERLVREGRVQARLRHPNVVTVTDVLDVYGGPGLLMDYIDGPDLEDWLHKNEPSVEQALEIFSGILSGVGAAHALDVVHRDLKPANVLMQSAPDGSVTPMVADFGIAKAVAEPGSRQTRSHVAMGTTGFMSPEQLRNAAGVNHRTDIFSLGCILYELVIGKPAFRGEDTVEIINAVTTGTFPSPRYMRPDLPEHVDTAIRGALAVDLRSRIPSCEVFQLVLDGAPWEVDDRPRRSSKTFDPSAFQPEEGAEGESGLAVAASAGRTAVPPAALLANPPPSSETAVPPEAPAPARHLSQATMDPRTTGLTADDDWRPRRPKWHGVAIFLGGVAVTVALALALRPGGDLPEAPPEEVLGAASPEAQAVPPAVEEEPEDTAALKAQGEEEGSGEAGDEAASDEVPEQPTQGASTPLKGPGSVGGGETPMRPRLSPAVGGGPVGTRLAERRAERAAADEADNTASAESSDKAQVSFTGADALELVGKNGTYGPGAVPAGTYTLRATFSGRSTVAGKLTVAAGETVSVRCDPDFQRCSR